MIDLAELRERAMANVKCGDPWAWIQPEEVVVLLDAIDRHVTRIVRLQAEHRYPLFALRRRCRVFRWGIHYHHPLCCVLRFSLSLHPNQGTRRGGKRTERAGIFVPCGILHHHDPDSPPDEPETRFGFGA